MDSKIKTGFAFGKQKGFVTKPLNIERVKTHKKRLFKLSESMILAKNIAAEICGLAPYEKKAIEMMRKGNDKRCKKFVKKRMGSMKATKKKLSFLASKTAE